MFVSPLPGRISLALLACPAVINPLSARETKCGTAGLGLRSSRSLKLRAKENSEVALSGSDNAEAQHVGWLVAAPLTCRHVDFSFDSAGSVGYKHCRGVLRMVGLMYDPSAISSGMYFPIVFLHLRPFCLTYGGGV